MLRVSRFLCVWLLGLAAACGGAKPAAPEPPKLPVPPHAPEAWLPADVSFIGRVDPPAFRQSPLWGLFELAQREPMLREALVDLNKVEHAVFAGSETQDKQLSFVAALSGAFGAGSVEARAVEHGAAPEVHGLLTFFRHERFAFAQVYPELVLACSLDRIEALATRATEGDAVKVRAVPLFQALSDRLRWDAVDAAFVAEDPRGEVKAMLQRRSERFGFGLPLADLVRAGASLKLGPSTSLAVVAEASGDAPAEALHGALHGTLEGLKSNILVGMLGLRPFLRPLDASRDGNFVRVGGDVAQADFDEAVVRLAGVVGIELGGMPPAPPAP